MHETNKPRRRCFRRPAPSPPPSPPGRTPRSPAMVEAAAAEEEEGVEAPHLRLLPRPKLAPPANTIPPLATRTHCPHLAKDEVTCLSLLPPVSHLSRLLSPAIQPSPSAGRGRGRASPATPPPPPPDLQPKKPIFFRRQHPDSPLEKSIGFRRPDPGSPLEKTQFIDSGEPVALPRNLSPVLPGFGRGNPTRTVESGPGPVQENHHLRQPTVRRPSMLPTDRKLGKEEAVRKAVDNLTRGGPSVPGARGRGGRGVFGRGRGREGWGGRGRRNADDEYELYLTISDMLLLLL